MHRCRGIIISGGPGIGTVEAADLLKETVFKLALPILGICFGNQVSYATYWLTCSAPSPDWLKPGLCIFGYSVINGAIGHSVV